MNIARKKLTKRIILPGVLVVVIIAAIIIYLSDYYRADTKNIEAFVPENPVESYKTEEGHLIFTSNAEDTGFIFYPGGKVEYTAYIPLMKSLASEGILCVLVKMPANLAVLNIDAAEGIPGQFPHIRNWYIGGHSLGGSMAAAYLKKCNDEFNGLVLLGSYSTADLSETDLAVLSIYGSEDLVLNREKYETNKQNLPEDFREVIIDGGCHAYFGMYGKQDGDGVPTINNEEQIAFTVDTFISMITQPQQ